MVRSKPLWEIQIKLQAKCITLCRDSKEHKRMAETLFFKAFAGIVLDDTNPSVTLCRDSADRKRMAAYPYGGGRGRVAASNYWVLSEAGAGGAAVVEWKLDTGRTHQISLHFFQCQQEPDGGSAQILIGAAPCVSAVLMRIWSCVKTHVVPQGRTILNLSQPPQSANMHGRGLEKVLHHLLSSSLHFMSMMLTLNNSRKGYPWRHAVLPFHSIPLVDQ
eukprot:scaffold147526_cov22-Tisochrysis_lutea.AAC.2